MSSAPIWRGRASATIHLARVLAKHVPTTLAAPFEDEAGQSAQLAAQTAGAEFPFAVTTYRRGQWETLAAQVAQADVCLFPSDVADELPQLAESRACLVVDGYDPLMAEWLALSRKCPAASPGRRPRLAGRLARADGGAGTAVSDRRLFCLRQRTAAGLVAGAAGGVRAHQPCHL